MKEGKMERRGIIGTDGFKGITGPFDGALKHGTSGNYAFFKGSKVYIYDPSAEKVVYSGTIGANKVYTGVPSNIDAVVPWHNGKIYFIKGDHYYRYDPSKLRVDSPKQVIGRVGFKNLFPGIDGASERGAAFQNNYYWEQQSSSSSSPAVPCFTVSCIGKSGNHKKTSYGYQHYEGVPPYIDAVLDHYNLGMPYFLKGSTYYRYNPKSRKVDQTGDIRKGWNGLPSPIDASYSSDDGYHYFFKGERWYAYDYSSKRLRNASGSIIKTSFTGVPNYVDAAIFRGKRIYFYKKNTEYVYDRGKRRVVAWNSIANISK